MRNFFIVLVKYINKMLSSLGLRSPRHWGVIYDSVTKQPVDPVVVKLLDALTGRVLQSTIVNMNGEYGFMADPGQYKIFAQRAHFVFPSKKKLGPHDGPYENIYKGEVIEFSGGSGVISLNVPLDPVAQDWNQEDKKRIVLVNPRQELLTHILSMTLFALFTLFVMAEYLWLGASDVWSYMLIPCLLVLLLVVFTPGVRLWGRVSSSDTGKPLSGVSIAISHKQLPDVVIASAMTTHEGKFFVRLAKGDYRAVITVPGSALPPVVFENVAIGSEGLLNSEFWV